MRLSDLQAKKIVSLNTGRNMGTIMDVEVTDDGFIEAILIEQNRNLFSISRENDSRIVWSDITKIGEDVILVKKN